MQTLVHVDRFDEPVHMRRRMNSLEVGVREAVAPRTVPANEGLDEAGATLADLAFIDGTTSILRLARRASQIVRGDRDRERRHSHDEDDEVKVTQLVTPPPPPPPLRAEGQVKVAMEAAAQRRASLQRGDSLSNASATACVEPEQAGSDQGPPTI